MPLALAVFLIAVCVVAAPWASVPGATLPGFVAVYEAALVMGDLVTAILLLGQVRQLARPSLIVLACGYFFTAAIVLVHVVSFPGLFAPASLFGGAQTTAWLYTLWHSCFPFFVLAYAMLAGPPGRAERRIPDDRLPAVVGGSIAGVVALVGACVLLTTAGHDALPRILDPAGRYVPWVARPILVGPMALAVAALAGLAWRTRLRRVLDVWLAVVLLAWSIEVLLSAVLITARFEIGFYLGRIFGLLAAGFVLIVLLSESLAMYGRLARTILLARGKAAELERVQASLQQTQRLEAIGQITGGVAHDFNNLLMVITGSLDLVIRHPQDADRVRELASAAIRAADRGQRLTGQLLTFARRQVTQPEIVNPNRLITELGELLRKGVGGGVEIDTALSPVLDPANIDPAQFEAALLNLVINARDAMEGSGCVLIATENVSFDEARVAAMPEVAPGRYVRISVSDSGVGMTADVAARAFEPFFTTKEPGRGSGLGLSQVYGFAKGAGGHLAIESEPGCGTTVSLYLPCSTERLRTAESDADRLHLRPARGGETVLVVEDDPEVRWITVHHLRALGYRVESATNAAAALDLLATEQKFDLLFSDVVMPGGMNGAQLAVEARRLRPELRILLTSGYTAEALGADHGVPDLMADGLLAKPYRQEELAQRLQLLIGGKS